MVPKKSMEIISHRGLWYTAAEKNTTEAFENSFSKKFGTETDIRDYKGELVISHDIADESCISVARFLEIYNSNQCKGSLALNIKADGLQDKLNTLLTSFAVENYFVFDMSVPDTIQYKNKNITYFSRCSEYEQQISLYETAKGIWLDAFEGIWYDGELIRNFIADGKKVALVSPELHKREPETLWDLLKSENLHTHPDIILCTDLPEAAELFFQQT